MTRTEFSQSHGPDSHTTSVQESSQMIAAAVTGFLQLPSAADRSSSSVNNLPRSHATATQLDYLVLTKQLWDVMQTVWPVAGLRSIAGLMLAAVLGTKFDLDGSAIRTAWSELCAALVSASDPGLLERLVVVNDSQQREVEVTKHLWSSLAAVQLRNDEAEWTDLIALLTMPLG